MSKQLTFHADLASVTVFVNGHPTTIQGEVDVVVREPTKKSRTNKVAWALVSQENAVAVSLDALPGDWR